MNAEDVFISMVQSYPFLYNKRSEDFKNKTKKNETWKEIGKVFNITGDEASKKFTTFRQKYVREKNMLNNTNRSGSGASSRQQWHLMPLLSFLDDYIEHRKTSSNLNLSTNILEETIVEFSDGDKEEILLEDSNSDDESQSLISFNKRTKKHISESSSSRYEFEREYESPCLLEYKKNKCDGPAMTNINNNNINGPATCSEFRQPELNLHPIKKKKLKNNYVEPKIVNILDKLSTSLDSETKETVRPEINLFCQTLAQNLQRLPMHEADDVIFDINKIIYEKLKMLR